MDQQNSQMMAVLAYLGPLALIPYFMKPQDEFTAFHTKQGIKLFLAEIITLVLSYVSALFFAASASATLFVLLTGALNLVSLGWLVLSILGVVNVIQGKKTSLPLIG